MCSKLSHLFMCSKPDSGHTAMYESLFMRSGKVLKASVGDAMLSLPSTHSSDNSA